MSEARNEMHDFWGEPISVYTRAEAIGDGVLVDVSELAREAGFMWPVAITQALDADVRDIPKSRSYQDDDGRRWDVLFMASIAARGSEFLGVGATTYPLIMHVGQYSNYRVKMVAGPGDDGEPTITLMRPEED